MNTGSVCINYCYQVAIIDTIGALMLKKYHSLFLLQYLKMGLYNKHALLDKKITNSATGNKQYVLVRTMSSGNNGTVKAQAYDSL